MKSSISKIRREIVLNRLAPLVGPPQRVGRGACYASDGSINLLRTAGGSTCAPEGRLFWSKFESREAIDELAREADLANRPFSIVLSTLFEAENRLLVWDIPYPVLRDAIGSGALYIYKESDRHTCYREKFERPLGDLDLERYCFDSELSITELHDIRFAISAKN